LFEGREKEPGALFSQNRRQGI